MAEISYTRPLRIQIQPDDLLFFMHIPKTGGLSLIQLIEEHFDPQEVFPLHSVNSWKAFEAYDPEQLARYRLVRGHFKFGPFDRSIFRYFSQNPLILTMLRDPVARTISAYRYVKRDSRARIHDEVAGGEMNLLDFVTHPPYFGRIVNMQTRAILGSLPGVSPQAEDRGALSDEALLMLAKQRLESFAFFGLTERFEDSVRLMNCTFGWPAAEEVPSENVAPSPSTPESISSEALDAIQERTRLDAELYAFAERLFEDRIQQMEDEMAGAGR